MTLEEAINASLIYAARGYDDKGQCVVSVAYYGDTLMWLKGFGGNWSKDWEPVKDEDREKLAALDFRPSGPRPDDQIEDEIKDAISEILDDNDDFEPIGERPDWV